MKNQYKIDYNKYSADSYPYALYVKSPKGFIRKWEFIASFKTKEEARELFRKLTDLPEYL